MKYDALSNHCVVSVVVLRWIRTVECACVEYGCLAM